LPFFFSVNWAFTLGPNLGEMDFALESRTFWLATSDPDLATPQHLLANMSDSEDQAGVPLIDDASMSPPPSTAAKRKREDDTTAPSKRALKRQKSKKSKNAEDAALDVENGLNPAIGYMDSKLMADLIAQRTKRFRPDVSLVEAEDLHIPERAILDTTTFSDTRTTDKLPIFLEQFAGSKRKKKLSSAPNAKGSPHTLVIAGAGLRAADLTRVLRVYQTKDCMVAKLFAKHIKLKEAVETVSKGRIGIGVGTPQRIVDLLEDGELSLSHPGLRVCTDVV